MIPTNVSFEQVDSNGDPILKEYRGTYSTKDFLRVWTEDVYVDFMRNKNYIRIKIINVETTLGKVFSVQKFQYNHLTSFEQMVVVVKRWVGSLGIKNVELLERALNDYKSDIIKMVNVCKITYFDIANFDIINLLDTINLRHEERTLMPLCPEYEQGGLVFEDDPCRYCDNIDKKRDTGCDLMYYDWVNLVAEYIISDRGIWCDYRDRSVKAVLWGEIIEDGMFSVCTLSDKFKLDKNTLMKVEGLDGYEAINLWQLEKELNKRVKVVKW